MPTSQRRCTIDASVLIDLHRGGVLCTFLALPGEFTAPDFVLAELVQPSPDSLLALGLHRAELSGEEVREVIALRASHPVVSVADLSALMVAKREQTILLTGDGTLRRLAQGMRVEVHGTLWALDWMVEVASLTPREAARALRDMLRQNSRLPADECQTRLRRWERQP